MALESDQVMQPFSTREGIMLIVGFVVVSFIFAGFVGLVNAYDVKIALPMLSIAGIVLLLISLTGVSYVFRRAGLQDKTQALGLPAGSIQSVIALSLIVLFAILSVFLFTSLGGSSSVREIRNLSLSDRNDQMTRLGSSFGGWEQQTDPEKFTLFVRDPGIEARNDVGKQLIVLIGTLMTSAVSFYFGSRATVSGAESAALSGSVNAKSPASNVLPVITTIEPATELPKGQATPIKITGSGFLKVTNVVLRQGNSRLNATDLRVFESEITCIVTPSPATASGSYDVVILIGDKELLTKNAGLKVAA